MSMRNGYGISERARQRDREEDGREGLMRCGHRVGGKIQDGKTNRGMCRGKKKG